MRTHDPVLLNIRQTNIEESGLDTVLLIYLIAVIGYLLGNLSVKGVQLGKSVVLIVALVFGHYGHVVPPVIKNLGLAMFVAAVGLIAGPVFFKTIKDKAASYFVVSSVIVVSGTAVTVFLAKVFQLPKHLAVGIFNGAMTTTPGLATAIEIENNPMLSVGYGITYLFGIIGVVLFVQLWPKLLKVDIVREAALYSAALRGKSGGTDGDSEPKKMIDPSGMLVFSAVTVLGILLGSLRIRVFGNAFFSLGITGGPLFMGILGGHFNTVGTFSFKVPGKTLSVLRDFGLLFFLIGAGTEAGQGFFSILREYGVLLFLLGVVITIVPIAAGCFVTQKVLKMDIVNAMGAMCGGLTSTPALGALTASAKNEDVSIAYAAAYPIALILIIFSNQFMMFFL